MYGDRALEKSRSSYGCDERPDELERWDAASVLTRHAGHDPACCLPYAEALARLSTPLS